MGKDQIPTLVGNFFVFANVSPQKFRNSSAGCQKNVFFKTELATCRLHDSIHYRLRNLLIFFANFRNHLHHRNPADHDERSPPVFEQVTHPPLPRPISIDSPHENTSFFYCDRDLDTEIAPKIEANQFLKPPKSILFFNDTSDRPRTNQYHFLISFRID